jgi:hypothetical protein
VVLYLGGDSESCSYDLQHSLPANALNASAIQAEKFTSRIEALGFEVTVTQAVA